MSKKIKVIFAVFCLLGAQGTLVHAIDPYFRTEKKHFKEINKHKVSAKTGKRFVLVQTAKSATIRKHPTQAGSYQLVLHDISPYIQFYKTQPSKSFGLIFMRQYVWFCKIGKSAFLKCKRGALGYISYDSKTKEASNGEVIELVAPHYHKKENQLIYDIKNVDTFEVHEKNMDKVTLIIDLALN